MVDGLNPAQLRALIVALSQLEKAIETLEHALQGSASIRLEVVERDFGVDEQVELQRQLTHLSDYLTLAVDQLQLEPGRVSGRRQARASLTAAWAGLVDVRSAKLKRYGAIDPAAAKIVDPVIDQCIAATQQILGLLEGEPEP